MKRRSALRWSTSSLAAALCAVAPLLLMATDAQGQRRPASPAGTSATQVGGSYDQLGRYRGGKWIDLRYGRPIKRSRDLFGPHDWKEALNDGAEVWRAGANYSTVLQTEVPLVFGSTTVFPGEYTVFIELGDEVWTLIISRWPAQKVYDYDNKEALFGAYYYTADRDVLRMPMQLEERPWSFDQLSWQFLDMSSSGGRLALFWDHKMASVPFSLGDVGAISNREPRPASPTGRSATEVLGRYDVREGYVSGRWIDIRYGRPIRRGRSPFGPPDFAVRLNDGAPVWRAGANLSTLLRTEVPLVFAETTVEPGQYTVFVQLTRDVWTLIISSWPAQEKYEQHNRDALFGAFHYRPNRDVVRLEMKLETLPHSFEQLSWQFLDMSDEGGRLALLWDDRMASVPFRVGGE